jgi:hypothetical protein
MRDWRIDASTGVQYAIDLEVPKSEIQAMRMRTVEFRSKLNTRTAKHFRVMMK